jgi:hypothetical protein
MTSADVGSGYRVPLPRLHQRSRLVGGAGVRYHALDADGDDDGDDGDGRGGREHESPHAGIFADAAPAVTDRARAA